jgi:hypothetical protein
VANKNKLTWVNPTTYTDGTAYDPATENAGYELSINGAEASVALPFAFGTEFEMKDLEEYRQLPLGEHTVRLRVITKQGVASDYTGAVTFRKDGQPLAPANLAVV